MEKKKVATTKKSIWTDIVKPSEEQLAMLQKKFNLHPVIVDELRGPSARMRVEEYPGYLYFIYFFPIYDPTEGTSRRTEIDFIVTKDTVTTIHYDDFKEIYAGFDENTAKNALELTYQFIRHLVFFEERQLRHIREKVEAVGKKLFHGQEEEVLREISYLKRDVSEYRIVVRMQEPNLRSLAAKGSTFWGGDAEIYLNDLFDEQLKIVNQAEDCREAITDFERTNTQLMNLKTNSVMKTLTALSFLTFPSMLFLALFSTHAQGMPIVELPYAFWILLGILAVVVTTLITFFKKKDWL